MRRVGNGVCMKDIERTEDKSQIFTVALLQLMPCETVQENLQKGLRFCQQAKAMGADLALFPELWQVGYSAHLIREDNAIDIYDNFVAQFCAQAKELEMAIAITYLGKGKVNPTNSLALIDSQGTILFEYAKVHACYFDKSECDIEAGNEFKVASLNFNGSAVDIGAMICFDREFPESARTLMLKGAEIVLTPNACHLHDDAEIGDVRLAQLRGRAFENMVGIAMTNYPAPRYDGHSCAYDVDGAHIVMADEKEGIFLANFDLKKIRKWREEEVWGNKYRRENAYKVS